MESSRTLPATPAALGADGKPQAGMGISAGDYDLDGNLDLLKNKFRWRHTFALPQSRRRHL
jgi:hypothetical protein